MTHPREAGASGDLEYTHNGQDPRSNYTLLYITPHVTDAGNVDFAWVDVSIMTVSGRSFETCGYCH